MGFGKGGYGYERIWITEEKDAVAMGKKECVQHGYG